MCNIQLYKRINKLQRWLCKSLMAEFSHRFKWLDDGRDSLLDIGCGPGDVTADFILSALPPQFSRIVCADISDKMLNAARQTVRSPNSSFEILDIGKPLDTNVWTKPFDHITSFSALHWAPDKQQTMENIYNLLKPGANCFLMFLSNWSIFTVANELANHPKWASRLPDIDRHLPSYQFSSNSAKELESIMQNVGFSEFEIEVRDQCTQFDGIDHLKSFFRAIVPFISGLTSAEQDEFMDDFAKEMQTNLDVPDVADPILSPFSVLVVFARK